MNDEASADRPDPAAASRVDVLFASLQSGDRAALGRAITLLESRRPDDRMLRRLMIDRCSEADRSSLRIGISGPPGAGKSTLIEKLGLEAIEVGRRVAVLAVDPSSRRTGGSILGDKTRMDLLSARAEAFIRPTPSSGLLGGVAEMTRETALLCEAAGYDVVLIETVGVGQAEFGVHSMVDYLLLVTIPGAGDLLQGIKRGIVEMVDAVVVNKADGDRAEAARTAAADLATALRLTAATAAVPVSTVSAKSGDGIVELWASITHALEEQMRSGVFVRRRSSQRSAWFEDAAEYLLRSRMNADDALQAVRRELLDLVESGAVHPVTAASRYVDAVLASDSRS